MSVSEKVSLSDALSNGDVLDELTLPGRFCNISCIIVLITEAIRH